MHGHHIDFWTGLVDKNPFPDLADSKKHLFKACLVKGGPILETLLELLTKLSGR